MMEERLNLLRRKVKIINDLIPMENNPAKQNDLISDLHTVRKEIWAIENKR